MGWLMREYWNNSRVEKIKLFANLSTYENNDAANCIRLLITRPIWLPTRGFFDSDQFQT